MNIIEAIREEAADLMRDSHLRYGQAIFTATLHVYEPAADQLVASALDPYYDDAQVEGFLLTVEEIYTEDRDEIVVMGDVVESYEGEY